MPDRHDPDVVAADPVEEPVRADDDLSVRKLGKLGQVTARLRETLKPTKHLLRSRSEALGGRCIVLGDIADGCQELASPGQREPDGHLRERAKTFSASASTLSKEKPRPEAISRSPRASSRKISRSLSLRS